MFGPLMLEGAYFTVTGAWSLTALALSVPVGLLVTAIVHGNEWRDISEDARAGIVTLSSRFGKDVAYLGYMSADPRRVRDARAWGSRWAGCRRPRCWPCWPCRFLAQVLHDADLGATGQVRAIAMIDLRDGAAALRLRVAAGSRHPARRLAAVASVAVSGPRLALGLGLAQAAFAATFRGPRQRFWSRMTMTGLGLGAYALAARPDLPRRIRLGPREAVLGLAAAGSLYGTFALGDRFARRFVPSGERDIADIYELARPAAGRRDRGPAGDGHRAGRRSRSGAASCRTP